MFKNSLLKIKIPPKEWYFQFKIHVDKLRQVARQSQIGYMDNIKENIFLYLKIFKIKSIASIRFNIIAISPSNVLFKVKNNKHHNTLKLPFNINKTKVLVGKFSFFCQIHKIKAKLK